MAELAALAASLERLQGSGCYSDLTIKCKGTSFQVHRAIVCAQSKVFAAMVDGNWKESVTSTIDLDDDDPSAVSKMVSFLYGAKYSVEPDMDTGASPRGTAAQRDAGEALVMHANLYVLGDKYDIPPLKEMACRSYEELVKTRWYTKAYRESAELVYGSIVAEKDPLKDVIYEAARANIRSMVNQPGFQSLLRRINNFAADLLVSFVQKADSTQSKRRQGIPDSWASGPMP